MELLLLAAAVVGVCALFVWQVSRPRVRVAIHEGRAELARGQLPAAALGVIADVARQDAAQRGAVEIRGRRDTLELAFPGLSEGTAQRLRNVLLLQRDRL